MLININKAKCKIEKHKNVIKNSQKMVDELNFSINQAIKESNSAKLEEIQIAEKNALSHKNFEYLKIITKENLHILAVKTVLAQSINEIELTVGLCSKLKKLDIDYVWQVAEQSERYWHELLIRKDLKELVSVFKSLGLFLGMDVSEILEH